MGLRDITIHRTTVTYRDQPIELRGISAADLMAAAADYGPQMALIFGQVTNGEFDGDTKAAILRVAKEMPDVVGAAIALASDDYTPETVIKAQQLPFNIQVECVEAIFNETFYSEADVKKLLESLTRMLTAISGAMTQAGATVSLNGIGDFAVKRAS